ncbi:DHA2 family efflux MFS transporter permease subunit [Catenulispora sp. NF23]|uniref:DHA2 family efflux MFS transporter permease subunit n=1 Tax=Catenulispora pinistramenti TaxID=2705254 RepID=A0ABS5KPM0_9ACTN|nr:DHA2 family efflux MFS transporter permease subunit [Catenulispora pinistramenti]MBS2533480.1 DHA2 family efflux MFS transporter permease subunit [Catenulispora pinistramenti]MBS2547960.1 DHA2 family efflux MFS transporter permease subunit [Catenulispora pinistramenti]
MIEQLSPSAPFTAAPRPRQLSQKAAVSVVFVAAMFMNIMDITIVNVALPAIGRQFAVTEASLDAVATGYLVSLAVFIPAAGYLGDRFGAKRVLLLAIAVFTAASVLCGLAGNLGELVAYRVLQGAGSGMMTPVGMAMLYRAFPPHERLRASSILTIPTAMAPALGPVLGGALVTGLSWRWVFFVNLFIGAAAFVFGLLFLAEQRQPRPGRFDVPGFVLSGVGFAAVMYGISQGPGIGWTHPEIIGGITAGAAVLAVLVRVELRAGAPLLRLRLLGNRLFRSTTTAMAVGMAAFLGALFVVPLFFQLGLGLSALQSGLNTLPEALGVMLGAQLGSRVLYRRLGPRRLIVLGLTGTAVSVALMALISSPAELWWMRLLMLALGLAMGQVVVSTQAATFATVSPADTGHASSLFAMARQIGSATGIAVLATVFTAVGTTHTVAGRTTANLTAYHTAFLVAALIALAAVLPALTVKDADAASTVADQSSAADRPESAAHL